MGVMVNKFCSRICYGRQNNGCDGGHGGGHFIFDTFFSMKIITHKLDTYKNMLYKVNEVVSGTKN